MVSEYDYLVVGAGAAGSVLANRLTASGRSRVAVIEAGHDLVPGREPADIRNVFPLSSFNPRYLWPDTLVHWRRRSDGPAVPLPQGRIVGGSSQVMGMWAMRGHPSDYDEWAAEGATGWGWQDVLPYFNRLETDIDFDGPLHGRNGPLPIRRERPDQRTPVARAIHAEAMARGWDDILDTNADFRDGHGALPVSREENGRASAGLHYLDAATRRRTNLDLRADCVVNRLLFEAGRVVGVVAIGADGHAMELRARTTLVTAGALRSPVLLMRSGIGPSDMLRASGIEVMRALPGVGRNLRNHAILYVIGMLSRAGRDPPGWRPAGSTFLRWTSGLTGTPPADMALYVRSYLAWHAMGRRMASLAPCLMRPGSAGLITLDPGNFGAPLIEFDMLADPRDLLRLKEGLKRAVDLFAVLQAAGLTGPPMFLAAAAGLARYNSVSRRNALLASAAASVMDLAPALGRALLARLADMRPAGALLADDAELTSAIEHAVTGTGHVCGTCRMGQADDPLAVVDPAGRVHGVPGLMVADASVMPNVPSGNTHLPTVMVAEKIAAGLTGTPAT